MTGPRRIGVSMRELRDAGTGELRDALAATWDEFIRWALPEAAWIPLPNVGLSAAGYVEAFALDAIILSGGDDVGASARRDATERALLAECGRRGLPVLGVCRGAQLMWIDLGGSLVPVTGHVAARHALAPMARSSEVLRDEPPTDVNSYHRWGLPVSEAPLGLIPLALAPDGSVEMFSHPDRRWFALMWHPEREAPFRDHDRWLVRQALGMAAPRLTP